VNSLVQVLTLSHTRSATDSKIIGRQVSPDELSQSDASPRISEASLRMEVLICGCIGKRQ
jgi:hypothetical protein